MEILNGQAALSNYTIDELRTMVESSDMQTFALACEGINVH